MTVAPYRSLAFQFNAVLACVLLDLVLAVVVLRELGAGPAFVLFAIAAVGVVNLVLIQRKRSAQAQENASPRG